MKRKILSIVAVVALIIAAAALVVLMWVLIFVFPAKDRVMHLLFIARAVVVSLVVLGTGFYAWATSLRANAHYSCAHASHAGCTLFKRSMNNPG